MVYLWHAGMGGKASGTASGLRKGEAYVWTFEMGYY
jgi:hypothetical protein